MQYKNHTKKYNEKTKTRQNALNEMHDKRLLHLYVKQNQQQLFFKKKRSKKFQLNDKKHIIEKTTYCFHKKFN